MSDAATAETTATAEALGFKLSFFKLIVRDIDRMVRFYTDAFGMMERNRIEQARFREVMLTTPGESFTLVLIHYTDGRAVEIGSAYGPVGFYTRDLDAAIARTTAHGATLTCGPSETPRMRVCFISDPEGHEIEMLAPIRSA